MNERSRSPFEQFGTLRVAQEALARRGYVLYPVEREHTEGLVTGPLVHRLRTQVRKRGFTNVAGKVAITFSGYAADERELFAIPEVRAYWQALDRELPELPALLAILPESNFNGPGQHLKLIGTVDEVVHRPALGGYDVFVADAEQVIDDAVRRIRAAGRKYHLSESAIVNLVAHFMRGARFRL